MFLYNEVGSFGYTFDGCSGLTGSGWGSGAVPETVSGTIIYNAENQTSPPYYTDVTFNGCTSLTNYASIPAAWK